MPNRPHAHLPPITLAMVLVITQVGCVALNIPSRRHHDPGDRGGLFGSWRQGDGLTESDVPMVHPSGHTVSCPGDCGDPACEEWGGCESGCGMYEEAQPPEIPWPRFHPVPSRPIFGSPSMR